VNAVRVLNLVTNANARFFKQQVQRLADRGVEHTVLPVPGVHESDGDRTRSVADYTRFVLPVLREARGDYDIVHANYGLTAPHALLQPWHPVVVSLWGSDLMGEYGWLSKRCARWADATVVMSEQMADELERPCYVLPHGVNLELFAPADQDAARAELGWGRGHQVLFPYPPGRDVKDYPRAERVVAAAEEALGEPITINTVSGVPHDQMPTYMNAADCLLLTSKREGSPNSVKEAMACNTPVVATPVGDVRERLRNVTPSAVCETDEALTAALVEVLSRGTRSNGRAAVRDVSVEQTIENLYGVYETVLEESR